MNEPALQLPKKVYYANHSSHFDFLTIWAALPDRYREELRPVAALDYWGKTPLLRKFSEGVLKALLLDRSAGRQGNAHPLSPLVDALEAGSALLIFPEGTRKDGGEPADFKIGIYHLAKLCPGINFVPVRLENLARVLPKGEFLPVPIIAQIHFGKVLQLEEGESKKAFLRRAQTNLTESTDE